MDIKNRIEIARNILINASKMNASEEVLLKISRKIDKYVVEYYMKCGVQYQINKKNCGDCKNIPER
ncbi:aspartyl-phosphate phosphatase Spo0E family protein [Pelotomaculum isophthalicicum JI]|uniref:Aspartyl-phosphate phosphatase Spo0E family protein n=1 Tax=Pelotomaculum isophthalicicum JI TaxID=947010 RepID=A0A9X4H6R8_9FIRM|nr:aspartyl-phosphate phosphatase Spo0E family protein [Pelotomaculum isophthalicicum]MDF9408654.1 aspartyl-phosphate phosphatase Spo0E family protein [Pelotomaculum isophthalicicum JI]